MDKFYVVLSSIIFLLCSCNAQTQSQIPTQTQNFQWKEYTFDDAGIKIKFPCEAERKTLNLRENNKSARFFTFNCDNNQVSFLVQLWESFDELDSNQMQQKLDEGERKLKENVGQENNFESKSFLYQNKLKARIFNITNLTTSLREIDIINKRGLYKVVVFFPKPDEQSKRDFDNEFENISKTFFDSFQIIEK